MLEALSYSVNAVAPVFVLVLVGWLAVSFGKIKEDFFTALNKLVYTSLVPISIFQCVYTSNIRQSFDRDLVLFIVAGTAGSALFAYIAARIFVKKELRVTFTQSAYKNNYLFVALPVLQGLFGAAGLPMANMVAPFVAVSNELIIVAMFESARSKETSVLKRAVHIIWRVVKNPLCIAPLLALPFAVFNITITPIIARPIEMVAAVGAPAALFGLGGAVKLRNFKRTAVPAVSSALIKTLLIPAAAVLIAVCMGFRGVALGIIAVDFGAPMAANSYAAAVALGGDGELAANSLLLSMLFAIVFISACMTLLISLGLA